MLTKIKIELRETFPGIYITRVELGIYRVHIVPEMTLEEILSLAEQLREEAVALLGREIRFMGNLPQVKQRLDSWGMYPRCDR